MPVIMFSGGYPGRSPTDLGATYWFDFTDKTQLFQDAAATTPVAADGDPIGRVNDKITAGYCSTAVAGEKPTYKEVSPHITGYADFGANDVLASSFGAYHYQNSRSGTATVFIVWHTDINFSAEGGGWSPGQILMRHKFYGDCSASNFGGGNKIITQNSTSGTAILARIGTPVLDTVYISTHIWTGNGGADPNWTGYSYTGLSDTRTASLVSANATGNWTGDSTYTFNIGAYATGSASYAWDGGIAEIVIFLPQISEDNRKLMETWLAWKHGLTLPY